MLSGATCGVALHHATELLHIRQESGVVPRALAWMAKDFLSCPGVYPALGHVFHPLICLQLHWLMLNESSRFCEDYVCILTLFYFILVAPKLS